LFKGGVNMRAVYALIPAAIVAFICTVVPQLRVLADFSLFVGAALAAVLYRFLMANHTAATERLGDTTTLTSLEKA
jgi:NCS1 family nucleobase:cation symporter-1